jgi:hypothetical protein
LKFDFFFFLGFTVQFVVMVLNIHDVEFALTIAVIPITIGVLLLAAWFTRRENKGGMIFIIILYFGALAYFMFKLVRMFNGARAPDFKPARKSLATFAIITLILVVITIVNAFWCMANFGKGLKPHITDNKPGAEVYEDKENHMGGYEMNSSNSTSRPPISTRMTIE